MPFLLRSREMFWVSCGGWVPPPPQFGVRRGGLAPQRSLGGQGDAGTPAPGGEHRCSRGTGGKGELEAAGGQMPRTGTGRVEGGECINRK